MTAPAPESRPPDLEPVARRMTRVVAGVPGGRLAAPTPCEEMTVGDLLHHVHGLSVAFRDAARKDLGVATGTDPAVQRPSAALLPADWREDIPRRLGELAAAWRDPGAWEGVTQAGGVTLPAGVAGRVALNELLLHGWDLARATGQEYTCDEESLRVSAELLEQSADGTGREGIFGPVVEVPPGAPLLDRVVGLGGRRPGWSPAALRE
ncbi:TIGR03086 family metal-binding protein [Streptomyces sp. TRM 70361]|uniref:TIGR03086 family metal-binding protein n=1 Tax=Streptomyces sp. TRM 70361 TaxID=3116553 RepID=UPI002E7B3A07|nr:TIGR03086 family metal-binding protein [Streptomyces sp. TRM 70361]MEE1940237.1 TIGR03086 family metal-binding protein [Streptomyces sp. TRM 70361]